MKIKIVGRWSNLPMTDIDEIVYDIYYGFSGLPAHFLSVLNGNSTRQVLLKMNFSNGLKKLPLDTRK